MRIKVLFDSPETSALGQIALRQASSFSALGNTVTVNKSGFSDLCIIHNPYIKLSKKSRNVFYLHFELYDSRHGICLDELIPYLKEFFVVICINSRQKAMLDYYGVNTYLLPHGYDQLIPEGCMESRSSKKKITVALVASYYGGNVKGELYFQKLANLMDSDRFRFVVLGSGWGELAGVSVVEIKEYSALIEVLSDVDVLYIGSRYEAGPASLPEAIRNKCYIMSSRVGMSIEYLVEGSSGYFLTFNSASDSHNLENIYKSIKDAKVPTYGRVIESWDVMFENFLGWYRGKNY